MNRILQYLGGDCDCCRARRVHDRWEAVAHELEEAIGGTSVVELSIASVDCIADGRDPYLSFYVAHDPTPCDDLSTAREHIAGELRTLADLLCIAAVKLEGGAHHG